MSTERHSLTARLEDGTPLNVKEGSITLDDTWAPYVQAEITIATPASTSATDPRNLKRLVLVASRTVSPATAPVETRTFNLHVRSRRINSDGDTVLTLASAEALLEDLKSPFNYGTLVMFTVREFLAWLFTDHLVNDLASRNVFALTPGPADALLPYPADELGPRPVWLAYGQSYWDLLSPILQATNLRLWCDELNVWRLTIPEAAVPGTVTLLVGDRVTGAEDLIDRDSELWADKVVMTYSNTDEVGTSVYPPATTPCSFVLHIEHKGRAPFNQFSSESHRQASARNVYNRLQSRGRLAPVDAVSVYSTTPGQAASISTPATSPQAGVVQAVTWRFPAGDMTVTTRNLNG